MTASPGHLVAARRPVRPFVIVMSVIALLSASLGLTAVPASAAVLSPFTIRYQVNAPGAIELIGNAVTTCSTDAANYTAEAITGNDALCDAARSNTSMSPPSPHDNNDFFAEYIDVDGDLDTFNSSSSTLAIPTDAQVAFAGLYWSGYRNAGKYGGSAAPAPSERLNVRLRFESGDYADLAGQNLSGSSSNAYQGFVDVTSIVHSNGAGEYTVANVQAATGGDVYGGWAMVVVFTDPTLPMRNLTVFDGFASVQSGTANNIVDIAVSGFRTPLTGPVNTQVGLVSFEGDRGSTGDSFKVMGDSQSTFTTVKNAVNPATNVANSTVSNNGVLQNDAPSSKYANTFGVDIDRFANSSTLLKNGETSATLRMTTSGETWFPSVVTVAVDVFAPKVALTKTLTNITDAARGANPLPGDVLEYAVTVDNAEGQDTATELVVSDEIPAGTLYVDGSAVVTPGSCVPVKNSGRSVAESDGVVTAYLGSGASSTAGGSLRAGCSSGPAYTLTFQVTVVDSAAFEQLIVNVASADYRGLDAGYLFTSSSNEVEALVGAVADLVLTKTATVAEPIAGQTMSFKLAVANEGPSQADADIVVTDTLPTGLTYAGYDLSNSPGWACDDVGQDITCTLGVILVAGQSAPDLFVFATVDSSPLETPITNVATVTSPTLDPDATNNTSNVTFTPSLQVDLAITKLATTFTSPGSGSYTMVVTNNGPSGYEAGAVGPTITDTLPAGVTCAVPAGAGWDCSASPVVTFTSALGTLAAGESIEVVLPVDVDTAIATTATNTASVELGVNDPMTANNTATSQSDVSVTSDLDITKVPEATPVVAGSTMVWDLTVTNNGPAATPASPPSSNSVVVQDSLPPGMRFVSSVDPTGWTCGADTPLVTEQQTVTCTYSGSLAVADPQVIPITVSLDGSVGGVPLTNIASVAGPNEACDAEETDTPKCLNNATTDLLVPIRGSLQVASLVASGNSLRTGVLTIEVNCPNSAELDPGSWPKTVTVPVGGSSSGTGIIPISVLDTCTITQVATGAPAAPATAGSISARYGGKAWATGSGRVLPYQSTATVTATSSSNKPVSIAVTSPCRLAAGILVTSTGTGSCPISFSSLGARTVTSSTSVVDLVPPPPSRGCNPCSGATVNEAARTLYSVMVNPADSTMANRSIQVIGHYASTTPHLRVERTVTLAKIPIPLDVVARSTATSFSPKKATLLVRSATTLGVLTATVRCGQMGRNSLVPLGEFRLCRTRYMPSSGSLSVKTFGSERVAVQVIYVATPTAAQTPNYYASTATRVWRTP